MPATVEHTQLRKQQVDYLSCATTKSFAAAWMLATAKCTDNVLDRLDLRYTVYQQFEQVGSC